MMSKPTECFSRFQSYDADENRISSVSGMLLFLFAFGFRLIYVLESADNPLFGISIVDAHSYSDWADRMVQGVWLWDHVGNYLPIYPAFLAVVRILLGESPFAIKIVQSLLGSLSALLMAQAAARAWNRSVGLITGYLIATYWMLVVFEAELYAESFSIFFQSLTLWLLICRGRRRWAVLAAGFAFALSAGARANLLLALPVVVGWLIWQQQGNRAEASSPGSRSRTMRAGLTAAGLFCIGTLVIIGPIVFQNYRVSGAPMLRAQGTWSLYSGVSPEFGALHPPTGILYDKYMHMPYRAGLRTEPEFERYWWEKTLAVLREDPGGVAVNFLRRLVVFFNMREWSQEIDVYTYRGYADLLSLPWPGFWLVGPLGLLGFGLLRNVNRDQWLIIGWTVVGFLSIIPFKVSDRYRLPTAVLLTCFAALAIRQLTIWYRAADRRKLCGGLALLAAFWVLCWPDWQNLAARKTARHDFYVGLQLESLRRYEEALPYYEASMQEFAWDPDAPYRIGHILIKQGRIGRALVFLKEALGREPDFPKALNDMAVIYLRADLPGPAEVRLQKSLQLNPTERDTLLLLAQMRRRQGDPAAELSYLRRAAYEVRNAEAPLILADRLVDLGYYEDAVRSYDHVMRMRDAKRHLRVQAALKAGYTAARYLPDSGAAVSYWRTVSEEYHDFRFFALQADFLTGALGEAEFMQAMGDAALWKSSAFYAVGLRRRLAGDIQGAAAAFEHCLAAAGRIQGKPQEIPMKWAWEDLQRLKDTYPKETEGTGNNTIGKDSGFAAHG